MKNFGIILSTLFAVIFCSGHLSAKEYQIWRKVPSATIKATASSEFPTSKTEFVVDGSGMENHLHQSNNLGHMMWMSQVSEKPVQARPATKEGVVWLLTEFEQVRKIDHLSIWNYDQDNHTNRGLQKVYLQYSSDGENWYTLKDGENDFFILPKAGGKKWEPESFGLDLNGLAFKYFCITADLDEGNYYHDHSQATFELAKENRQNINYYGLSEIAFFELETVKEKQLPQIDSLEFEVFPAYRKTEDGPAREYQVQFNHPLYTGGSLELACNGKSFSQEIPASASGIFKFTGLFPAGYMDKQASATVHFTSKQGEISETELVDPARKWNLYFLAHSHLDIGYTHVHGEVLALQIRNLKRAIDLIEASKDFPAGSKFKWNVETLWPVTEWMKQGIDPDYYEKFKKYVRSGDIGLNGTIGSILTGICKQEELMHLCDDARAVEKETGVNIQTAMMSDVPGLAWGTVTGLAQNGIKYLSMAPNYVPFLVTGGSRVGYVHREWGDYPFYWESQSGADKVLYWASGKGYSFFHDWLTGTLSASGLEPIWQYLDELQDKKFPYDISYLRYTVNGDNGPPDSQMAQVIRKWNETYEYPKFIIGTSNELFTEFEQKYSESIPSYKGDFTPYWEEGAASTAAELATNRENGDRLSQLEILWSMLKPETFPFETFKEAWRNVVLFSEHTWGASASYSDYQSENTKQLWNEKKEFALKADSLTKQLANFETTAFSKENSVIQVYNTCAWPRTNVVKIKAGNKLEDYVLKDSNGETAELQRISEREWIFIAKGVPALSSKAYHLIRKKGKQTISKNEFVIHETSVSNGLVSITINSRTGAIQSFKTDDDNHNYATENGLNEYIYSGAEMANAEGVDNLDSLIISTGPVATVARAYSKAPGCQSLVQEYTIYKGLERVDIENKLDKKEVYEAENVRFGFPFNIPNSETVIDLAFSKMRPEREQLDGSNKNFFCMNNGVSIEGQKRAVLLGSSNAPILEIGAIAGEEWRKDRKEFLAWKMTAESSPILYSWVMNNSWHTNYKATQSGKVSFHYSLVPLKPYADLAKKKAFELSQPLIACFSGNTLAVQTPFEIRGSDWVAVSVMRPAKDGTSTFVRLINLSEKPVEIGIAGQDSSSEISAVECDNKEKNIQDVDTKSIWMKPYATINLKLTN